MRNETVPVNPENPVNPVGRLSSWLDEMADCPLPGAVSAGAVAAAMGAALLAKVARLVQQRQPGDSEGLRGFCDLAGEQRRELLHLAHADVLAFRQVLDARDRPPARQAWQDATDVPLRVAEACLALEDWLPALEPRCPPAVLAELRTGAYLLETGRRSGLLAADTNLRLWAEGAAGGRLRARLDALKEGSSD
jgi:formiminotetrahydrofolate cyclodeaminase